MIKQVNETPALLIIDMVKDNFIESRNLPITPFARAAIEPLNKLIEVFRGQKWPIVFSSAQSPLSVAESGQIHRSDCRALGKILNEEPRKHESKNAQCRRLRRVSTKTKPFFLFVFQFFVLSRLFICSCSGSCG